LNHSCPTNRGYCSFAGNSNIPGDENNNLIRTKYEYPWIFAYSSYSLIKDKNIFGRTCITVIDHNNDVRLIDLKGNEIEHTKPIEFHGLNVNYAKMFTLQAVHISKRDQG